MMLARANWIGAGRPGGPCGWLADEQLRQVHAEYAQRAARRDEDRETYLQLVERELLDFC
jgi:hypothetical protein